MNAICPTCEQEIAHAEIVGGTIHCPTCVKWFSVPRAGNTNVLEPAYSQPASAPIPTAAAREAELVAQQKKEWAVRVTDAAVMNRAANIRARAGQWCAVAVFCAVVAGFAFVMGIVARIGDASAIGSWSVAGVFIGLAFWSYLIAQVIHIRAYTER